MTLSEYMTLHGLSANAMAKRIGCAHTTVLRLNAGDIHPSRDLLAKVARATNGAVQPGDFFQTPPQLNPAVIGA